MFICGSIQNVAEQVSKHHRLTVSRRRLSLQHMATKSDGRFFLNDDENTLVYINKYQLLYPIRKRLSKALMSLFKWESYVKTKKKFSLRFINLR